MRCASPATPFASIGLDLGATRSRSRPKFGFDQRMQIPLNAAVSAFRGFNAPQTAQAAIGQFDVRATAMQMAMVAAGVANNGQVMKPYSSSRRRARPGRLSTRSPRCCRAVTPQAQLQDMMKVVVDSGTGRNAQIDGVFVGGKTGTAPDRRRSAAARLVYLVRS